MRPLISATLSLVLSFLSPALATASPPHEPEPTRPFVGPMANPDINQREKLFNFGFIYVVDWGFYILTQHDTIQDDGSFQNWSSNWYQPHFDNDSFEFNIFQHTLVGQGYYQFYRSRGYDVPSAFMWSFASSLAFEMFIETATERPSLQDIYQTPVYGTILGIGLEKTSQACHSTGTWLGHVCGYILDPFTLFPKTPKFVLVPEFSDHRKVVSLAWEIP